MPPPHNLPLQLTSFVGREREIAEVKRLLGTSRLLTLTGAGGTGKTRLALHVASQIVGEYPDGAFFVNLAPVTDHELVLFSIAQTLGVIEAASQPLIEKLKAYLQGKEILLLLDNFEQVLQAGPTVVDLLLTAPDLKVLATSRELLHLQGEQQYQVPTLELPDPEQHVSVEELSDKEAVALFVERARSASPDFELTEENAPAVAQICSRLDGLPLAIELATARIRVLSPQAMLSRLESRLTLLTGGAHDLPSRHQTLRNTIEWSFNLLEEREQQLFTRMSVFQGGSTLEALETVSTHPERAKNGQLPVDVLDGVQSLVSKSLLQLREGTDGVSRFVMLETIHEYASEKLRENGEADAVCRAHALYFMRLAEESETHLTGARQQEWTSRLADELDNFRSALRWARVQAEHADARDAEANEGAKEAGEIGLRTAGAIWRFWEMSGLVSEGREQLEGLIAATSELGCSQESRLKVLGGMGALALWQDDYGPAGAAIERTLSLGRQLGDKRSIAHASILLGAVLLRVEDDAEAKSEALFNQSLALYREADDKWGVAYCLSNLGRVALSRGDYATARSFYEEGLAARRQVGDKTGIANSLRNLGWVALWQGDYAAAVSLYEESLGLFRELGHKDGIAISLYNLGIVSFLRTHYSEARSLFEQSLPIRRELGDKLMNAACVYYLGLTSYMQGDYSEARSRFSESLAICRAIEYKWGIAVSVAGYGEVATETGRPDKGARLLGAAHTLLAGQSEPLGPADRIPIQRAVATARARLGAETFEKAWQEGRATNMEQAIAYALEAMPESEAVAKAQATPKQSHPNELTRREVEVLQLLALGLTNRQIAERLFLAGNTVRAHLYSIYSKLGVSNRTAAAHFVQEHRLM